MTPALALLGCAVALAWAAPLALAPLTRSGLSARLGLTAWLSAMASVLACAGLALQAVARTAVANWPSLTRALCQSVAGGACTPAVYRSALYELGVGVAAALLSAGAVTALWRCGRRVQRVSRQTREHATAARMTGRALPGTGAVVLSDPRPAAYCVSGRPAAIVVTSGALAVLDRPQLAAVLAHERAHLSGRHNALALITRGLAAAFPAVPLFTRGAAEVARLAEMTADDAAARESGRPALIAALLAIGTGAAVPAAALRIPAAAQRIPGTVRGIRQAAGLQAAGYAVPARVERMLSTPRPAHRAASAVTLAVVVMLLTALPGGLAVLPG